MGPPYVLLKKAPGRVGLGVLAHGAVLGQTGPREQEGLKRCCGTQRTLMVANGRPAFRVPRLLASHLEELPEVLEQHASRRLPSFRPWDSPEPRACPFLLTLWCPGCVWRVVCVCGWGMRVPDFLLQESPGVQTDFLHEGQEQLGCPGQAVFWPPQEQLSEGLIQGNPPPTSRERLLLHHRDLQDQLQAAPHLSRSLPVALTLLQPHNSTALIAILPPAPAPPAPNSTSPPAPGPGQDLGVNPTAPPTQWWDQNNPPPHTHTPRWAQEHSCSKQHRGTAGVAAHPEVLPGWPMGGASWILPTRSLGVGVRALPLPRHTSLQHGTQATSLHTHTCTSRHRQPRRHSPCRRVFSIAQAR